MITLITGANRGIGLELTRRLLVRGERVFAACRRPDAATALHDLQARDPGDLLTIVPLDVTDPASIATCYAAVQQHTGTLDVLVNNAGVGDSPETLGTITQETLLNTYTVNAAGPLLVAQQFLPMVKAGSGKKIINVSSSVGSIASRNQGGMYAYCASKAALNMHSKNLSLVVAEFGITSIVINPGWVKTDMGGPNAHITSEESVTGMLKVLDALTMEDTGKFLSYTGEEIPW
jgi:NAD(P)-dependent dehydrogenase (short-subunit alcohol dehydrogenase family)